MGTVAPSSSTAAAAATGEAEASETAIAEEDPEAMAAAANDDSTVGLDDPVASAKESADIVHEWFAELDAKAGYTPHPEEGAA
jgi:hypothetical protein